MAENAVVEPEVLKQERVVSKEIVKQEPDVELAAAPILPQEVIEQKPEPIVEQPAPAVQQEKINIVAPEN